MRCFVAVTVGASITEAMSAVLGGLRTDAERCGVKVSWSRPESWHATVKFFGEIESERSTAIARRLAPLAGALEPFPVEATGLITLPHGARIPNVIAVALSDDGRFSELARRVDEAAAEEGFEPERRRFLPHLTLGRVRAPRGWRDFKPSVAALRDHSFGRGQVQEMTLYSSKLGDGPARYETIATADLGSVHGRTDARP